MVETLYSIESRVPVEGTAAVQQVNFFILYMVLVSLFLKNLQTKLLIFGIVFLRFYSFKASIVDFTEKMLRNFMNHLNSFTLTLQNPNNYNKPTDFVPYNIVQEWFNTFQRRLQLNPTFWKSLS